MKKSIKITVTEEVMKTDIEGFDWVEVLGQAEHLKLLAKMKIGKQIMENDDELKQD